jgi:Skp family chaperone for outer membrane proteins
MSVAVAALTVLVPLLYDSADQTVSAPPPGWLLWASLIPAVVAALVGVLVTRTQTRNERKRSLRSRVKSRLKEIDTVSADLARLMAELKREVEDRQRVMHNLEAEAEEQQRLLEIDQEQAELVRQILLSESSKEKRSQRLREWMFFTLGVVSSVLVSLVFFLIQ